MSDHFVLEVVGYAHTPQLPAEVPAEPLTRTCREMFVSQGVLLAPVSAVGL